MNQSYNIGNLKTYEPSQRPALRIPESAVQKGRPRESQPPMFSAEHDLIVESNKSSKDFGLLNSPYQSKHYKPFDTTGQQGSRQYTSGQGTQPYPVDARRPTVQTLFSEKDDSVLNRLQQQGSPKLETGELGRYGSGNNRTMPLTSSGNKIDKQAYLNKIEPIQTNACVNQAQLKKTSIQPGTHDSSLNHYSSKVLPTGQDNPFQRQHTQPSPLRKAPRLSEPVFQQGYDDDLLTSASTASGSPSQGQQLPKADPRFLPRSNEIGRPMKTQQSELMGHDSDLFKKQKEFRDVTNPSTNFSSTLQSFRTNMRKSEFKSSDFMKGRQLGSGKFGKVEIVKHKSTGFVCAMKTVPKALILEEKIIGQFTRELKIQSCLDHPNITKMYGFFDDKENIYLLLELGSEGQLYQIIKKKKRLSENTTSYIMKQICEALKYLHSLNILHRDIKPQNIVITYNVVKLCDFGWAVNKGSELRSTFCGTPLYVSPEILKGQSYDDKIDVWSVGILTYQLLIGDIPFQISSEQQLIKIIKEDITFPKDVPISDEAKDFVLKILKKNPDERLKVDRLLEHPFLQRNVDASELDL